MRFGTTVLAFSLLFGAPALMTEAEAAAPDRHRASATRPAKVARALPAGVHRVSLGTVGRARAQAAPQSRRAKLGGISCVPYARQVTGMQISGNGWQWWHNAAGSYARGTQPEDGSILAFRSTGGMRLGHVAVVRQVLGPRHILIDHANWGGPGIRKGSVMTGVHVIDVSANNDWTETRVQVGRDGANFGRVYPTYGFIYNRQDTGTWYAEAGRDGGFEQIAEAPISRATPARRKAAHHRR